MTTIQAEDEIAGVGAALGAAFGGAIGVTTTSGPGLALKAETIGLAVRSSCPRRLRHPARRPLDGAATKTEQADLLQAMFGRNGESPVPIVAPRSPADCFDAASRRCASRRRHDAGDPAVRRLPRQRVRAVVDPGGRRLPDLTRRPRHGAQRRRRGRHRRLPPLPARPRDPGPAVGRARHARPRAPDRRHREGQRHRQHLLRPRQPRPDDPAAGRARSTGSPSIPPVEVDNPDGAARVLVFGWGSTSGPISAAASRSPRNAGIAVAQAPTCATSTRSPPNLDNVLRCRPTRCSSRRTSASSRCCCAGRDLVDVESLTSVRGLPFTGRQTLAGCHRRRGTDRMTDANDHEFDYWVCRGAG